MIPTYILVYYKIFILFRIPQSFKTMAMFCIYILISVYLHLTTFMISNTQWIDVKRFYHFLFVYF